MKSLELNWIKNFDKSLIIPEIVFISNISYSGIYYSPRYNQIYDDDNRAYDMIYGTIVINSDYSNNFADIIAHEWRHHWQLFHGWKFDTFNSTKHVYEDYDNFIFDYFTKSKCEMDALRFELKYSDIYESWKSILYPYIKDLL
jgi:hypothetical protein